MRRSTPGLFVALVLVAAACGSGDSTNPSGTNTLPAGETGEQGTTQTEQAIPDSPVTAATSDPTATNAAGCADVIAVDVRDDGGAFAFATTIRSDETGWDKYADWWEVRDPEGKVLGIRELAHPHETEQPFTRSLAGVAIPAGTSVVEVVAHDSVLGFCGASLTVVLPGR